MDLYQLQQGRKIHDTIKEHERILDYFVRRKTDDPIKALTGLLNNSQNLSSLSEKKELALLSIKAIEKHIEGQITDLKNEFEKL